MARRKKQPADPLAAAKAKLATGDYQQAIDILRAAGASIPNSYDQTLLRHARRARVLANLGKQPDDEEVSDYLQERGRIRAMLSMKITEHGAR